MVLLTDVLPDWIEAANSAQIAKFDCPIPPCERECQIKMKLPNPFLNAFRPLKATPSRRGWGVGTVCRAEQSRAEHYPRSCPIAPALSRYGEVFPEADTWEPETDPHREELKDLLRRRRWFVDQRVQEKGRLDKGISATIAKSTKRHIAWLEKEIARLDQAYQAVLPDNATLAERAALYRTVPGIGPLTVATLVAQLPELGHWDSKALTSLVGLAPWSRDSGKKRGHRAIRGGRGLVRRALYMCAWAVIRHDSEMRRFYDRLRQRGKPGNVAVVAVMRKILLQLNAVARRGTPWVPQDA